MVTTVTTILRTTTTTMMKKKVNEACVSGVSCHSGYKTKTKAKKQQPHCCGFDAFEKKVLLLKFCLCSLNFWATCTQRRWLNFSFSDCEVELRGFTAVWTFFFTCSQKVDVLCLHVCVCVCEFGHHRHGHSVDSSDESRMSSWWLLLLESLS